MAHLSSILANESPGLAKKRSGEGKRVPDGGANVETLDKIARVLRVSVADLIEHVPDEGKKET